MFTGIIESIGTIEETNPDGSLLHLKIASTISSSLKPDQSVSHNGVCLTVTKVQGDSHWVTLVHETLIRSTFGKTVKGDLINLERSLRIGDRLDGHFVQGHVDDTGQCEKIEEEKGSRVCTFSFDPALHYLLVDKGSVCINGVSLTVIAPTKNTFSVALIPYTWDNTNFKDLHVKDRVNLEFDIIGKYITGKVQ